MKTRAGPDCRHYHEDFHRGRSKEECRLLYSTVRVKWKPSDCVRCPVPQILWANASPNLELDAMIQPGFIGLGCKVVAGARCRKHGNAISDPYVGCERCAAKRPNLADLVTDTVE